MSSTESPRDEPNRAPPDPRVAVRELDRRLAELWRLGRNVLLGWDVQGEVLLALFAPSYRLRDVLAADPGVLRVARTVDERLIALAARLQLRPERIPLGPGLGGARDCERMVDAVTRRYVIRQVDFRAAALVQIDGLDGFDAIDRLALLSSLSFSINVAQSRMAGQGRDIDIGRSTVAGGYLLWNRQEGAAADQDLFCLVTLALADNALARTHGDPRTAPQVKTAFHVGRCYEFHQPQGLSLTISNSILGPLTDELEAMAAHARPNQIILAGFTRPLAEGSVESDRIYKVLDTPRLLGLAQSRLSKFDNALLDGRKVSAINIYLTGDEIMKGTYNIKYYNMPLAQRPDFTMFNAKINIHRPDGAPIFLGLQNRDADALGLSCRPYDPHDAPREYLVSDRT